MCTQDAEICTLKLQEKFEYTEMIALFCRALDCQDVHTGCRDMYFTTPGKGRIIRNDDLVLALDCQDVHTGCRDMHFITPGKGRIIRNDDLVLQGIRFQDVHAGCRDMYFNTPGKGRLIRNDRLVLQGIRLSRCAHSRMPRYAL
ncbi:hypothetical protein CEXT_571991 [Caerostris extrusa]|uniref:Uncharacterized protein n=1 Tax=Caerostris extrusa TaxID=172846 RepID=A0AAV4TT27_CAEEX|nr:hypothetical protein CEXT_571991 [Caerostris extrusa]